MRFRTLFWRSCRLKCPVCGRAPLFAGWFKMHARCPACDASFQREEGFYLGSIYFNYGLTALIVAITYPVLLFTRTVPEKPLLFGSLAFTLLFPLWFFRYARALWLGFDQWMDPQRGERSDAPTPDQPPIETRDRTSDAQSELPRDRTHE